MSHHTEYELDTIYNDMQMREFWLDIDENEKRLEYILRRRYNQDGSNYKVFITRNQSSSRLTVKCMICNVDLSSFDPLKTHNDGKNHRKMAQQGIIPEDRNLSSTLEFKPLNLPKDRFKENSLEDRIDRTKHKIIGLTFIYKEVFDDQEYFSCQLCERFQVSSETMFKHLTGENHSINYINATFPSKRKQNLNVAVAEIEQHEGRIFHDITTLQHTPRPDWLDKKPKEEASSPPPSLPLTYRNLNRLSSSENVDEFLNELKMLVLDAHHYKIIAKYFEEDLDCQEVAIALIHCMTVKLNDFAIEEMPQIRDSLNIMKEKVKFLKPIKLDEDRINKVENIP